MDSNGSVIVDSIDADLYLSVLKRVSMYALTRTNGNSNAQGQIGVRVFVVTHVGMLWTALSCVH